MNHSNYFQFYNEFLYQQHKSLLQRVQKCKVEENENFKENWKDFSKQDGQDDDKNENDKIEVSILDKVKDNAKETSLVKRTYSSTSESEIGEQNLIHKSSKNLRRKRPRRSLSKKHTTEEYDTSSTSSAHSETESILNTPGSSELNRSSSCDILNNKLLNSTEGNNRTKEVTNPENNLIASRKVFKGSETLKIETDRQLPKNLKSFGNYDQNSSKTDNWSFKNNANPEEFTENSCQSIEPSFLNLVPSLHNFQNFLNFFEQDQIERQHLMQFQNSTFSHINYFQFYEIKQNFHFHPHLTESHKDLANQNESFNQIYLNHTKAYGNGNDQNISNNEGHNNFTNFNANPTKHFPNPTETHQELLSKLYLNCNKPFIQPLSIPIQAPSTSNIFKCDNCPKIFKSIVRLENHIEKHHSRKLAYKCKYCRSSFKRKSKLLNHQHKSHSEKFLTRKKSSVFHNVELLAQSDCHWN